MAETVIIELIKMVGQILTAVISIYVAVKLKTVHKQMNSRMDEFLKTQKALGNAEGKVEGRELQKLEDKENK